VIGTGFHDRRRPAIVVESEPRQTRATGCSEALKGMCLQSLRSDGGNRTVRSKRQSSTDHSTHLDGLTCRSCIHFDDDPGRLEIEVPGILVFGSAFSSARGHAGMCHRLDRFLDPLPARDCPSFEAHAFGGRHTQSHDKKRVRP